jgi:hypothetical protein
MSATHATHKDQASRVAVRALILESLTESACLMRILSLELNPLIDPPWRRREELYYESNGNNLPEHLLPLQGFVINIPIATGGG